MLPYYEYHFLKALCLTITVETTVIVLLCRYMFKSRFSWTTLLFAGIFPSFATLPYVWFIFPLFFPHNYNAGILFSEITVTLIETLLLYMILKPSWREVFILSVAANATSFGIGWILQRFFHF